MTRTEQIMKAIKNGDINSNIEEMMKEDIRKAEAKRIQEMFKNK